MTVVQVVVIDRMCAPDGQCWVSQSRGLKLIGREITFEEFQPM